MQHLEVDSYVDFNLPDHLLVNRVRAGTPTATRDWNDVSVIFLENLDVAFMQHLELTSSYASNISSNGRKLAHISTLVTVILSK